MKTLKPIEPAELKNLSQEFGQPQRVVLPLAESLSQRNKKNDQRRGEVVMAIRLRNGKVLLHTKTFYPRGVFRLLSGGIHRAEPVEEALFREVEEETGLPVHAVQFVALIEYEVNQKRAPFASYVFLMDSHAQQPAVQDVKERILAFKAVTVGELRVTATQLRNLNEDWRAWGEYRVVAHELVAEVLEGSRQ